MSIARGQPELSIAVHAPHGRDGRLIHDLLVAERIPCTHCQDAAAFEAALGQPLAAAVLTQEGLVPPVLAALKAAIDQQPAWSNLPVVVLLDPPRATRDSQGLVHSLGLQRSVVTLERPMQPHSLATVLRSAVRARQRQYELRDALDQLHHLNATLERKVRERTQRIRQLAAELTDAEQRERSRLAHLLHENLQQLLVAAKMRVSRTQARADDVDHAALAQVVDLLQRAIDESRSLASALSPPILQELGLTAAVKWLAGRIEADHEMVVHVEADPQASIPCPSARAFLFQAVRELLLNVVKHAQTPEAWVTVALVDGHLAITVEDHGRGAVFEKLHDKRETGGFGLSTIGQRLELLGGTMQITAAPGWGCRITLNVPLDEFHGTDER